MTAHCQVPVYGVAYFRRSEDKDLSFHSVVLRRVTFDFKSLLNVLLISLFYALVSGVYGDVHRVKVLFNKKDNALIQMADPHQAQLGK